MLEAVRLLETEMRSGYDPLSVHISNALEKLRQRRPASKFDVLVDSDNPESRLRHPKDKARRNRAPRIFIGPIASANKLLKNPKTRDEIRDKFKVKAVEMEGSGIADSAWNLEIGYIAIRGICDYCDSRKDDRWHEYAAIVAAAYARTLLESICPIW
jgi:nucleoside phosphorylase